MTTSSFDDRAATWDEPAKIERAYAVATAITDAVMVKPSTRLLEYGAGTGLVSEQLANSVGPITLADPSSGMREVAEGKVAAGTLPKGTRVWDLDLTTNDVPSERFDLIVTVLTLHHIHDLQKVLGDFATLLDDNGELCVVDLEEEDGSFHPDDVVDVHHGFSKQKLTALLKDAGFTVDYHYGVYEIIKNERPYPLFLAVCAPAS